MSSRVNPIARMIFVRSCPAGPTKGSPCSSSSAPGASPTNIKSAEGLPAPNTTPLREATRWGHFVQTSAASRSAVRVLKDAGETAEALASLMGLRGLANWRASKQVRLAPALPRSPLSALRAGKASASPCWNGSDMRSTLRIRLRSVDLSLVQFPKEGCDFPVVESGRTVRLARLKLEPPSAAKTHTVDTTMPHWPAWQH